MGFAMRTYGKIGGGGGGKDRKHEISLRASRIHSEQKHTSWQNAISGHILTPR